MEVYGLDPETYHSEVINPDEPARMKKQKKNKTPFKGKSQRFVEASENEADIEVPNKEHDGITGQEKVDNTLSFPYMVRFGWISSLLHPATADTIKIWLGYSPHPRNL